MKIYVSATYRDLRQHRLAVLNILRRMGHQPIGMEDYTAEGERPLSRCLDDVAACDAYLCIVAWRYGFVPQRDNSNRSLPPECELGKTSVTEFEYRRARELDKPILAFVLDGEAAWPSHDFDAVSGANAAGACIARFRQELSERHLVNHFQTADELAGLAVAAIYRAEMVRQMQLESLNVRATFNEPFKRNGAVADSTLEEIASAIAGPERIQALQVNIGSGSDWWVSRLYFLCSLASDLTEIEVVVFEAGTGDHAESRFLGTIHPRVVKERLASQYDDLRRFEKAVAESEPESDLHAEIVRRADLWRDRVSSKGIEGTRPPFVTEANLERWLSPCLLRSTIDWDSDASAPALRMQRVVDWPMRFVPITEDGRFKQVIDKQALMEQVARLFIREQVSRAMSMIR